MVQKLTQAVGVRFGELQADFHLPLWFLGSIYINNKSTDKNQIHQTDKTKT